MLNRGMEIKCYHGELHTLQYETCPSESGQTTLEKESHGSGSTCFSATLIIHRKCRLGTMEVKCGWVKKQAKRKVEGEGRGISVNK